MYVYAATNKLQLQQYGHTQASLATASSIAMVARSSAQST